VSGLTIDQAPLNRRNGFGGWGNVTDALETMVRAGLDALEFDLVELRRGGSRNRPVLEVRIDRRDGTKVTIDDCARVSRALEPQLDGSGLVNDRYVLEVSSPGADRPLNSAADWRRFVGRHATVTSSHLAGGRQEVEIVAFDGLPGEEVARLALPSGEEVEVPYAGITRARLAFHWKR
jgi:ribosome maturation factor RimP